MSSRVKRWCQQVQKYERGANRVGASRLLELAGLLDVPVTFFFDDVDPVRAPAVATGSTGQDADLAEQDPLRMPETVELVTAFYRITNPKVRQGFFNLARALCDAAAANQPGDAEGRRSFGRRLRRARLSSA